MDMRCRITSGGRNRAQAREFQGKCHREETAAARKDGGKGETVR